jgi:hypothetical protein
MDALDERTATRSTEVWRRPIEVCVGPTPSSREVTVRLAVALFAPKNRFFPYHLSMDQSLTDRAEVPVWLRILFAGDCLTTRAGRIS